MPPLSHRRARVLAGDLGLRALERTGHLGVDEQHEAQVAHDRHRPLEVRAHDVRELVDARRAEEALRARDAELGQPLELARVPGHDAAPERDVDVRLVRERLALLLGRGARGRGRDAVERHVDDGRDPAGGRGLGGRAEALPLGAPRLVQVHVRVDDARRDEQLLRVDDGHARRDRRVERGHGADLAALDVQRRRPELAVDQDALAADHQVVAQRVPSRNGAARTAADGENEHDPWSRSWSGSCDAVTSRSCAGARHETEYPLSDTRTVAPWARASASIASRSRHAPSSSVRRSREAR